MNNTPGEGTHEHFWRFIPVCETWLAVPGVKVSQRESTENAERNFRLGKHSEIENLKNTGDSKP